MRILLLLLFTASLYGCDSQKKIAKQENEMRDSLRESIKPKSIVSIYLVTEIMMPDGSMRDVQGLDMTIEIQSQNRIMGYSGCNQFHGSYSYEDGVFSTSGVASTRKMCAENMDIENAFLKYLTVPMNVVSADRGIRLMVEDATALVLKKIDE